MIVLEEYTKMFGENPPKLIQISFTNERYQNLMKIAISRKKPLTTDEILNEFKNVKWDVVR